MAIINMTQPYFLTTTVAPESYSWNDIKLLREPKMSMEIPTLFGFTSSENPSGLSAELRAVMSKLRMLTVLREACRHLFKAEAANICVRTSTLQLCLEKRLLKRILLPLGESTQQLLERCCYVAALIFISTSLSPITKSYHPTPMWALWGCVLALRRTDHFTFVEGMHDLYLRCLIMGAQPAAWGAN